MVDIFFELIRVALGVQPQLSRQLTSDEWHQLYELINKQTLLGVCFAGVLRMEEKGASLSIPEDLRKKWFFETATIQQDNEDANARCQKVLLVLRHQGFEASILKGQGVARYYPDDDVVEMSILRQTGDIDIWMWPKGDWNLSHDERVRIIAAYAQKHGAKEKLCYHHIDMKPAKGFDLEAHFTPSWMYSPFNNHKLQRWFSESAPEQMKHDFSTTSFNLIYLLIHIFRHLFREGIGLRQVLDYYFVLRQANEEQVDKKAILAQLKSMGLGRFTAALMWILQAKFGMPDDLLLCQGNSKEGEFLLSEIMLSGNFGQFDTRSQKVKDGTWKKFWILLKRNFHFLTHYPSEVLWAPLWKIWHQAWLRRVTVHG